MACGRRSSPRRLAATLATALATAVVSMIGMLAFAPSASARVTVVPGSVEGGGTQTFAVRLSNEQPDLVTTRLELTFGDDVVVPRVEVARVGSWRARVEMRPVDPPVEIGGEEVDEAVASIVWTGGEVAPRRFEQFLVTAGPLPPGGGRLVLGAAQGYADGSVDRWTAPAERPGWPGAPTVVIAPVDGTPVDGAAPAEQPGAAPAAPAPVPAGAPAAAPVPRSGGGPGPLPWLLLTAGVLVAGVGGVLGYRQQERRTRPARRRVTGEPAARHRIEVGRR